MCTQAVDGYTNSGGSQDILGRVDAGLQIIQ